MENIVIGIEGLVGSGKTSICRDFLQRDESYVLLNGGNLYRAIVYTLMQKEIKNENLDVMLLKPVPSPINKIKNIIP